MPTIRDYATIMPNTMSAISVPQNQQFFAIWGPQHTYIGILYPTYAEAVTKVTELKQENPTRDYYILSAVSRAAFRESPVICEPLNPAGGRTADVEPSTRP